MFITKLDRAKRKMNEDFKKISISTYDNDSYYDAIDQEFQNLCNAARENLEFDNSADANDNISTSKKLTHSQHQIQPQNDQARFLMAIMSDEDLLKEFGIHLSNLEELKSLNEKVQYVMGAMKKKIQLDVREFEERRRKRQESFGEWENKYNNLKKGNEKAQNDVLSWMKVPTKFNLLKKKFHSKIVEKISDGKNYYIIKAALEEKKNSQHLPEEDSEGGIYEKNDMLVLENINFNNSCILDEYKMFMKNVRAAKKRRPTASTATSLIGSPLASPKISMIQSTDDQIDASIRAEPLPVTNLELDNENHIDNLIDGVTNLPKSYDWDDQKDKEFLQRKKKAKYQLTYLCNSSSWNQVAFAKLINEIRLKDNNKNFREKLIQRYMDGELLTEAEVRYITITSEGLNKYLDKKFFNDALKIIDEEVFDKIEMNIAENIIRKYKEIRKLVYDSRNQFLKKLNKETRKSIISKGKNLTILEGEKRDREKRINKKFNQKKIEKAREIVEDFERRYSMGQLKKEPVIVKNEAKNTTQSINKTLLITRPSWIEFLNRNFHKEINTLLYGRVYENEVKHKIHVPSKILVGKSHTSVGPGEKIDETNNYNLDQVREMNLYKISIKSPDHLKIKENFANTYSGGPRELQKDPKKKRPDNELVVKAITIIQNKFRKTKALKKYKLLKTKKEENQRGLTTLCSSQIYPEEKKEPKLTKLMSREFDSIPNKTLSKATSGIQDQAKKPILIRKPIDSKELQSMLKNTQLAIAVKENNAQKVLNMGFAYSEQDINLKDKNNNSLLYYAAKNGSIDICKWLIEKKAKVNEICSEGNTALHMAFYSQNPYVVTHLVQKGANLDIANKKGFTPLGYGSPKLLQFLQLKDGVTFKKPEEKKDWDNQKNEEIEDNTNNTLFKLNKDMTKKNFSEIGMKKNSLAYLDDHDIQESNQQKKSKFILDAYSLKKE